VLAFSLSSPECGPGENSLYNSGGFLKAAAVIHLIELIRPQKLQKYLPGVG
jgi:hypothetical protein